LQVTGYIQWSGQSRLTADYSVVQSTTLANINAGSPDVATLFVTLLAGHTYSFRAYLPVTCGQGGVKVAMGGTIGNATIIYDGYFIDAGSGGVKGNARGAALGAAVASAVPGGTSPDVPVNGFVIIEGTITVNPSPDAAGTLTVQFAQNTANATPSTVKQGATLTVFDCV
jgi:hypothetical protein